MAPSGAAELLAPTAALTRGFEFEPARAADAAAPHAAALPAARRAGEALQLRQGFRVGSLRLMVHYADGSELTDLLNAHRLPHAPRWLLGMANLHGLLVPVVDLARWFGVEREAGRPMLLVLGHGADAAGFVIDGLPERLKFDPQRSPADASCVPESLRPFVAAAHLVDSQLWLDLDVTALLSALEQATGAAH